MLKASTTSNRSTSEHNTGASPCAPEVIPVSDRTEELSHYIFVCRVSMRLLRFYILELYPSKSIYIFYFLRLDFVGFI